MLGLRIAALRRSAKLSQAELAEKLAVSGTIKGEFVVAVAKAGNSKTEKEENDYAERTYYIF